MSDYSFDGSFSDIPRFIQPRVRIFLSVDLVGSSKLKQAGPDRIQGRTNHNPDGIPHDVWLPELSNFYGAFPKIFAEEWGRGASALKKEFPQYVGYEPSLWKTNGDEIIFVKHVKNRSEIAFFISCWLRTVKRYKLESKTKLDVKSTGWCAGFPLINSEIILDTSEGQKRSDYKEEWKLNNYYLLDCWYERRYRNVLLRDYIGPSIDIGFRLCTFSSPNIFPVSVELAWFIAEQDSGKYRKTDRTKLKEFTELPTTRFLGEQPIRGVFGGYPYPVFYLDIDQNTELREARANLLGQSLGDNEQQKVGRYCEGFFDAYETHFPRPFIAQERSAANQPTRQYIESIRQLSDRFTQEKRRYRSDRLAGQKFDSGTAQANAQNSDLVVKDITHNMGIGRVPRQK